MKNEPKIKAKNQKQLAAKTGDPGGYSILISFLGSILAMAALFFKRIHIKH